MIIDVDSTTDNIARFQTTSCTLRYCKLDYAEPCPASAQLTKNSLSLESANIIIPTQSTNKYPRPALSATNPYKQPRTAPLTTPTKV